jgi:hypothetical protein
MGRNLHRGFESRPLIDRWRKRGNTDPALAWSSPGFVDTVSTESGEIHQAQRAKLD